jgi:hypothetical protein
MAHSCITFDFESLSSGKLGISPSYGRFLAEAASYCFFLNRHSNPLHLLVSGDACGSGDLTWAEIDESHSKTWADSQEATEYGAYGVAVIVAIQMTGIPYVERAAKLTGIDYWLGTGSDECGVFQRTARLEVSGILNGGQPEIKARLKSKLAQAQRSDNTSFAAYAAIIEFGSPEARLVERKIGQ